MTNILEGLAQPRLKRTTVTIQLDERSSEALAKVAADANVTKSAVVRRGILAILAEAKVKGIISDDPIPDPVRKYPSLQKKATAKPKAKPKVKK